MLNVYFCSHEYKTLPGGQQSEARATIARPDSSPVAGAVAWQRHQISLAASRRQQLQLQLVACQAQISPSESYYCFARVENFNPLTRIIICLTELTVNSSFT